MRKDNQNTDEQRPDIKGELWRIFNLKIKNNRSSVVVLVSFLLVSLLWFVKQVENGYIVTVDIAPYYTNLPQGYKSREISAQKFPVKVKMNGFNILSYKLSDQKLEVDMPKVIEKSSGRHFWIPSKHPKLLISAIAPKDLITHVPADTIYLNIGDEIVKTVPVKWENVGMEYRKGFSSFDSLKALPSQVKVYGTPSELAEIDQINLGKINYTDLHKDIRDSIQLILPKELSKVRIKPSKVLLHSKVSPYTQGEYTVSLQAVNVPSGYRVRFIPEKVKVSFRVSIDNYTRVKSSDFKVRVDFKNVGKQTPYVHPRVVSSPDFVSHVTLTPNKVDYVLVR